MRRSVAALILVLGMFVAISAAASDDPSDFAFRPHPGAGLPLAATLTDEAGSAVPLGRYFTSRPVVLVLQYLRCKTLCGLTLSNVVAALDALPLAAGRDFELLAIDIDPRGTPADAAGAKGKYLAGARHPAAAAGVHFLTGPEAAVRPIADAIGFPYRYDAATDQYLHPAGFVVASPDGRIGRYFFGIGPTAADLQAALADAAAGRATGPLTRLLLLCGGDAATLGRYTLPLLAAFTAVDLVAATALVALFAAIRRRRQR